jgi:hypothetical protein
MALRFEELEEFLADFGGFHRKLRGTVSTGNRPRLTCPAVFP